MNKVKTYSPLLWLLAIPVLNIFYILFNHGSAKVYGLMTDLDRLIPFVPAFVIPYLLWYPFIYAVLIILFARDRKIYYRTLAILCTGLILCYLIYNVFQTGIERPSVDSAGLLNWLVSMVYANDPPYNCFPSIHVLTCHIVLKAAYQSNLSQKVKTTIFVFSWTIILSTLFIKQHFILDIPGAILLSEILFFLMGCLSSAVARRVLRKERGFYEL